MYYFKEYTIALKQLLPVPVYNEDGMGTSQIVSYKVQKRTKYYRWL